MKFDAKDYLTKEAIDAKLKELYKKEYELKKKQLEENQADILELFDLKLECIVHKKRA